MRMSRNRLWVLAVAASAALVALGWPGCAKPTLREPQPAPQLVIYDKTWSYQGNPGQEIRTPHYVLYTTHSDAAFLEQLPRFMETAFQNYSALIKPTARPSAPMQVYLFGQRDQWEHFTDQHTGPSAAIYRKIQEGGYVHDGRAIFYDIQRLKTFAVTGHECFHQYLSHYAAHRPPAWLDVAMPGFPVGFTYTWPSGEAMSVR